MSVIQKTVQINNIIPWNPSMKKLSETRSSDRIHNVIRKKMSLSASLKKKKQTASSTMFNPRGSIHLFFLEDFINLLDGSSVIILLPLIDCEISKKIAPTFDAKFLKLIENFEFKLTQVGDTANLFHAINATIFSSPNRDQALTGIDRLSLQEVLNRNKSFVAMFLFLVLAQSIL